MEKKTNDLIDERELSLSERRTLARIEAESDNQFVLTPIKGIAKRSAQMIKNEIKFKKFQDLYKILSDEDLLIQAMSRISKNEGALTKGPPEDQTTADAASLKVIKDLAKDLKEEKFRFKPIRRIYIDKTGKNRNLNEQINVLYKTNRATAEKIKELKARPLGIPSFRDKIVQEAMRLILNAIYEPIFSELNCNFGFRQNLGCQDAITNIQQKAKTMAYAIEGDIKGAFDNVDFEIMIKILSKQISDQKFLRLILNGLKCGIIYENYRLKSTIGTTQGSIVSPILYNIYFHEFDKYIYTTIKEQYEDKNTLENRTDTPVHKLYNSISKKKFRLKYKETVERLKETYKKLGKNSREFKIVYDFFKIKKEEHKRLTKLQMKYPSRSKRRQTLRFHYVRYADDWIFLTNSTKEFAQNLKENFANWIQEELKLTLSPEKTRITDLKEEKAKFLGFQLSSSDKKIKRVLTISNKRLYRPDPARRRISIPYLVNDFKKLFQQRTTNPSLITAWDRDRVLPRLEEKRFIRKDNNNWRGCSKKEWSVLEIPEIIERYNYVIRGYIQYYAPVTTYPTDIQQLHYLLKYSCAHTLANKLNTSIRNIFKKFTKDITIKYNIKTKKIDKNKQEIETETQKETKLLNWEQCLDIIRTAITKHRKKKKPEEKSQIIQKTVDDICNVKINWRTKYKLSKYCSICGSTKDIEYHHVKHVRIGKTTGFLQVMKQLNRKQIPCCKTCHKNIHKGEYNGISLGDLYDEKLIIL